MKRTLAALVLSGGAAAVLTPVAAHADGMPEAPPLTKRLGTIAENPQQTVEETRTALGVAAATTGGATQSTLAGTTGALGGGLPHAPSVG
ncbi:hypothetical protein [Streptomyces sp. NPDC090022]|uniref:hypothetical protein n=1 Tax=Streptomyces sp. NPDC090022 TaxID=3365920 RepID=UPI0038287804